jgi:hypothetical protein
MSNATRRSFLRASLTGPDRLAVAGVPAAEASTPAVDRRRFLQASAGAAAGVAVVVTGPKLASAAFAGDTFTAPAGVVVKPSGPPPADTVMAYIRDAARGEVTVMSGTRETTFRDPALTQRLIDAGRAGAGDLHN